MVKIEKNIKDIKLYTNEIFWFLCKPFVIVNIILFPFIIYFLCVGIFADSKAFNYAIWLLLGFILFLSINLRIYFHYKKLLECVFKNKSNDGIFEEEISIVGDEIVITNTTLRTVDRIKKNEIKYIKKTKKSILFYTKFRQIFYFPLNEELITLFNL